MQNYTVRLVPKKAGRTCECGSWLDHWEFLTNKKAQRCSVAGCDATHDLVGGLVHKTEPNNWEEELVIPLCRSCNLTDHKKELTIRGHVEAKSSDPNRTCESATGRAIRTMRQLNIFGKT